MRRFVILAIAVTGLLAFGATTASAAANFKSQSFSVNNQGQLVCSFDVSGLGNVSSTPGSCTATSTADYQCINNGGKNPSAANKSTSKGETGTEVTIGLAQQPPGPLPPGPLPRRLPHPPAQHSHLRAAVESHLLWCRGDGKRDLPASPPPCARQVYKMKKSSAQKVESPSPLIDARIKELGDWRGWPSRSTG